jgi:acetylornithine/succinyldiaminopimelate/putrescine aminotransferase
VTDPYLQRSSAEIKELEQEYLFSTYKRYDLVISHGSGCYVYDVAGRRYLDFLAGIAVNALGYNHPRWPACFSPTVARRLLKEP